MLNKICKVIAVISAICIIAPGAVQAQGLPALPISYSCSCSSAIITPHTVACLPPGIISGGRPKISIARAALLVRRTLPRCASSTGSRPVRLLWPGLHTIINKTAVDLGIDPRIIEAVAITESGCNQAVISPRGAVGVMQIMPGTAKSLGVNPYNLEENIQGGAMYLKMQIERFGSLPLALAAYNAGPGAVQKYGGIPPYKETQDYVRRVMSALEGRS